MSVALHEHSSDRTKGALPGGDREEAAAQQGNDASAVLRERLMAKLGPGTRPPQDVADALRNESCSRDVIAETLQMAFGNRVTGQVMALLSCDQGAALSDPVSPVQRKAAGPAGAPAERQQMAAAGVSGAGSQYPHAGALAASFGQTIKAEAHFGPGPRAVCDALGAEAYTTGGHVAFASETPSLELAGHEAAHTLQQAQGLRLKGGADEAGDQHERAADHAAGLASRGESAAHMFKGPDSPSAGLLQLKGKSSTGAAAKAGGEPARHRSTTTFDPARQLFVVSIDGTPIAEVAPNGSSVQIEVEVDQSAEGTFARVVVKHDGKARVQPLDESLKLPFAVSFKEVTAGSDKAKPMAPPAQELAWLRSEYRSTAAAFRKKTPEEQLAAASQTAKQLRELANSPSFGQVDPQVLAMLRESADAIDALLPVYAEQRRKNLKKVKKGRGKEALAAGGTMVLAGGGPENPVADLAALAVIVGVLIIGSRTTTVIKDPELPGRQAEALRDLVGWATAPLLLGTEELDTEAEGEIEIDGLPPEFAGPKRNPKRKPKQKEEPTEKKDPDPRRPPPPQGEEEEEQEKPRPGAMRSQIQRGNAHLGSASVKASDPSKGVTAVEFEQIAMLGALADYRRPPEPSEKLPKRPKGNEPGILGAFARQSQAIRSDIIPIGVITTGSDINALREKFPDSETGQEVRVDVENLYGHNLRFGE